VATATTCNPLEAQTVDGGSRSVAGRREELRVVRFNASQAARQVYVLIAQADGSPLMLTQMEPVSASQWTLALRLPPGVYRYRFYAHEGYSKTYLPPTREEKVPMHVAGMDAVFIVPGRDGMLNEPVVCN
jgi:hypothetical protein